MSRLTKLPRCYIVIEKMTDYGGTNVLGVYVDPEDAEDQADFLNDEMKRKGVYSVEYSVIERPLHPFDLGEL